MRQPILSLIDCKKLWFVELCGNILQNYLSKKITVVVYYHFVFIKL